MAKLIAACGMSQEELAVKLGKSQSAVANKLRLLRLSSECMDLLRAYGLTERHARALLRLGGEEERYEKGLAIQAPIYGDEIQDRYTWLPKPFDEAVPRFLTELCFGDFYTRTGLDCKTRELLTVVLLAALGGAEAQVKSHVEGALKAGNTREEIVCALVHAGGYMGIPRLFNALNACKDLLADETRQERK